jgi:membrane protein YqaA with SNARE-associated domain
MLGRWGLVGLFLVNVIGGLFLFPSPIILASVVAAGNHYPPVLVALLAAVGSSTGDILGYFLGYTGRKAFADKKDKKKLRYTILEDLFLKFGGLFIFLFAAIPNPFFDAIGVVAGAFFYPPKKFFIYVFAGRMVRNILLAYIGKAL